MALKMLNSEWLTLYITGSCKYTKCTMKAIFSQQEMKNIVAYNFNYRQPILKNNFQLKKRIIFVA